MAEKKFAQGFIFKLPSLKAPDYVKGSLSVKQDDAISFINANSKNGWLNLDLLVGQSGKPYVAVNEWQRENAAQDSWDKQVKEEKDDPESLPF